MGAECGGVSLHHVHDTVVLSSSSIFYFFSSIFTDVVFLTLTLTRFPVIIAAAVPEPASPVLGKEVTAGR